MVKNDNPISKSDNPVSKYRAISTFVWDFFKKYLHIDADLNELPKDFHEFNEKYQDSDEYEFALDLLKAYFDELMRLKG